MRNPVTNPHARSTPALIAFACAVQVHLNALLKVSGVVTRRTNVFPQLKLVKYDCIKCGYTLGPFAQKNLGEEAKPRHCPGAYRSLRDAHLMALQGPCCWRLCS